MEKGAGVLDGPATTWRPVLSASVGTNADLVAEVARLYLRRGMRVVDLTFGRGVFWRKVDLGFLDCFTPCDIRPEVRRTVLVNGDDMPALVHRHDFRDLPRNWRSFYDVAVLDPPYLHGGATVKKSIRKCYKNGGRSTKYASHEQILGLYHDGILSAWRILKPGGLLWVKCQDEIESGRQRWSHVEIMDLAVRACAQTHGERPFDVVDLFVLVQRTTPAMRLGYQKHARKNHSYLLILRKR